MQKPNHSKQNWRSLAEKFGERHLRHKCLPPAAQRRGTMHHFKTYIRRVCLCFPMFYSLPVQVFPYHLHRFKHPCRAPEGRQRLMGRFVSQAVGPLNAKREDRGGIIFRTFLEEQQLISINSWWQVDPTFYPDDVRKT